MRTEDGCWAEYRTPSAATRGRPCLFLDRDGVLIEDTGYPHDPTAIVFIDAMLEVVAMANGRGVPVGLVSNQSGIGRGYFDWPDFLAVQGAIDAALAARGGRLDFVLACPHVAEASIPAYRHPRHPWRKPAPGMLQAAAGRLGLTMAGSAMLGDRASDMAAAAAAGVAHRGLLADGNATPAGAWTVVPRGAVRDWVSQVFGAGPA